MKEAGLRLNPGNNLRLYVNKRPLFDPIYTFANRPAISNRLSCFKKEECTLPHAGGEKEQE